MTPAGRRNNSRKISSFINGADGVVGTDLDLMLRSNGIKTNVIGGVATAADNAAIWSGK